MMKMIVAKNTWLAALLVLTLLGSGCSAIKKTPDAPIPENFPLTYQKQLQASQHWAAVAEDIANQAIETLKRKNAQNQPVFIEVRSSQTEFSKALNEFLITSFVQKGIKVSRVKAKSIVLDYHVQALKFNAGRSVTFPSQYKWTVLTGGVLVTRLIGNALDLQNVDQALLAGGIVGDLWSNEHAPKIELVVTSSVVMENLYEHRSTDIYYANVDDIHLYSNKVRGASPFNDSFYKQNKSK